MDLTPGDRIDTVSDDDLVVTRVSETPRVESTFSLTVENWPTFMVGEKHAVVHNADCRRVAEVMRTRRGSIRNAPLPRGAPSWDSILDMTMDEIRSRAQANEPGFRQIHKLLTDGRFGR